ncbi:hypothetical protein ETD86_27230 [Nonomuraea turkmeniaca]|uniref:Uncharacterized protein n=1 Tax=Nonomuraea turkmeniaca TaxID=103838 RepID=A0A5S4FCA7_9ACTN|nr:hypothetical protein [Nonomuraea turkmeniaca]TMR15471.1 hypothetical protein ETD86_27230 [Nonomuraea turkmeniaca]
MDRLTRWTVLAAGTALSLVAAHGRWEVAGAAWVYLILLLRFSRTSRALPAMALAGRHPARQPPAAPAHLGDR